MPADPRAADRIRKSFIGSLKRGLSECGVNRPSRLLVALSGGADSTALLIGLHELSLQSEGSLSLAAAHFNHQLQGEHSDADEQFCVDLCGRLDVHIYTGTANVAAHAASIRQSVEAAARELRYTFLGNTVTEHGFDAVVTGHTMDDQAETVLLGITRGAGLRGISGMAYRTERADLFSHGANLTVLRPLLGLRRRDTEAFCSSMDIQPRIDPSNADESYSRNRVRHSVIPRLEQINPNVVEAIARLASVTGNDIRLIDQLASEAVDRATVDAANGLSREALRNMPPALLTHVIGTAYSRVAGSLHDLETVSLLAAVRAVQELDSGSIDLPVGVRLVVEHDTVRFLAGNDDPSCPFPLAVGEHALPVPGEVHLEGGAMLTARLVAPAPDPTALAQWQAIINPETADSGLLRIRSRVPGDRFHPLGTPGSMKLQDFLVNEHVPARWRDRVPLIYTGRGICWVVGSRIAEWAKVPDDAPEAILLEYTPSHAESTDPGRS